jgi:hypothetical protein
MITAKQVKTREGKQESEMLDKIRGGASSEYIPASINPANVNPAKFLDAKKTLSDITAQANANLQNQIESTFSSALDKASGDAANLASNAGGLNSNLQEDDEDSDGLLAILRMIFKIVPIGTKIVKNTKTLTSGLKKSALGLVDLIKNLAITTMTFGLDSIKFAFELGYYGFKMMICSVGGVMNLHKCILFYLFDFLILFIIVIITSILFLIDMFCSVKTFIGFSCIELFIFGFDLMDQFDKLCHSWFGAHPFHYPDFVIKLCYKCDTMGDTSGFSESSRKIFNDVFVMVPNKIGSPIGNIVRGIGQVFAFFNV